MGERKGARGTCPSESLAALDFRFLLPEVPTSAKVLGNRSGGLQSAFDAAGIATDAASPDLVVCDSCTVATAFAHGPRFVVVLGRVGARRARRGGYRTVVYHWWRSATRQMFVPVAHRAIGRHVLRGAATERTRRGDVRSLVLRALVESGVAMRGSRVTVCTRGEAIPFVLGAAASISPSLATDHFHLECPTGGLLLRLFFTVYEAGAPAVVVKTSRYPGEAERFDGDEAGLRLAAMFGMDGHVPRSLARGRHDPSGLEFSAETAASGHPLARWLANDVEIAWARTRIDDVTGWIEAAHQRSSVAHVEAHPLLEAVRAVAPDDLAARLATIAPRLPAVLGHGDLGTWNILADVAGFTVIDWENARHPAPPLWDLWYFLADAYARLESPHDPAPRHDLAIEIFRGRHSRSAELFAWTRRIAFVTGVADEDVGPLAAACWLHHFNQRTARVDAEVLMRGTSAVLDHLPRLALSWFAHDELGADWSAYRTTR